MIIINFKKNKTFFVTLGVILFLIVAALFGAYYIPQKFFRKKPYGPPLILPNRQPTSPELVKKLKKALPYKTSEFEISYFDRDDIFSVLILKEPVRENAQKALEWFRGRGADDVCKLNIVFVPGQELFKKGLFENADLKFCQ